jgi:hypothetical protein
MIKLEETAFHAGCLRKRRRQAGRTARIMQRRDARCERTRFRLAPSRARLRRIGFDDFDVKCARQRSLDDFLAVATGKVEHAGLRLQGAGQRPDQFLGVPRRRRRQPPAARLRRTAGARADDIERRGCVGRPVGMERLVAGRDNGVVMRSPRLDGPGPDFDYGKADDGKAKPAQPGRARICVLARPEQGDLGARRPLSYGRGVGMRFRARRATLCRGWFPHPSRPQPVRKEGRVKPPAPLADRRSGDLRRRRRRHRCVAGRRRWPLQRQGLDLRRQNHPRASHKTRSSRGSKKTDAPQGLVDLSPLAPGRDRTERGRAVRDASAVLPPWRPHPYPRQPHSPGDAGGRGARSACRRESTSRQR